MLRREPFGEQRESWNLQFFNIFITFTHRQHKIFLYLTVNFNLFRITKLKQLSSCKLCYLSFFRVAKGQIEIEDEKMFHNILSSCGVSEKIDVPKEKNSNMVM